ncbi:MULTISPECIES: ThiF family adenylyltransferase [Neobacillus]|uniref:ThiF family adenylyltransferase n=1 Tax=Neobacillus citreus TaxID=2833578 RepID=A0A942Y784_9BACI|nr:ThiF family adenylyltransferase [Neobacillus citreus]MCH6265232.1 ThiF family adenylyltransferase [Neobacillus citreus]
MSNLERYSRQILFRAIGEEGQKKLLEARVVVIGAGALGTVIANHLVRSGVGYLRLIDRDVVELSNLQRQTLFDEEDAELNLPKSIAAQKRLNKINSSVKVDAVIADVNLDNAEELISGMDIIVDGTDNFMTRFLINDVAIKYGIPWVHGAAVSSRGMFAVIKPGITPCYRCLFPDVPEGLGETCDTVGVLSPLTDIIGSFQAMETIKYLVDAKTTPNLEQIDIWDMTTMQMDISQGRNPNCPACVERRFDFLDRSSEHQASYTSLCGRNTVQVNPRRKRELDLNKVRARLVNSTQAAGNDFLVRFSPEEGISIVIFKDARVLIHGTNDIVKAKSLYAKYIGE